MVRSDRSPPSKYRQKGKRTWRKDIVRSRKEAPLIENPCIPFSFPSIYEIQVALLLRSQLAVILSEQDPFNSSIKKRTSSSSPLCSCPCHFFIYFYSNFSGCQTKVCEKKKSRLKLSKTGHPSFHPSSTKHQPSTNQPGCPFDPYGNIL